MAITKTQLPDNLHSVFLPTYYTYKTNLTTSTNFYYKYSLTDMDGVFFNGTTVPLEDKLSFNDPTEILKSKTSFNFNPSITSISNIEDNVVVYNESVEEYSGGTETSWLVKTGLRYSDPDFSPDNYIPGYSDTTDFLVSMPVNHNIRATDDFTFRTYNGNLNVEPTATNVAKIYQTYMTITFVAGTGIDKIIVLGEANPYWNATASDQYTASTSGDDYMIELPVGLNNWKNTKFYLRYIYPEVGANISTNTLLYLYTDGTNKLTFTYLGVDYTNYIEKYEIHGYTWPNGTGGQVTKKHTFTIVEDCNFTSINVAWENTKGGVDYYLFTKANEKNISMNKDIYNQNINTLNFDTEKVVKNNYNKGMNVYRNEVETWYELHTDFLNQSQIDGLEDLFHSTEVYMNINSEWVSVISLEKKAIIYNKKRKGLKKYKLKFLISQNNVRY